VNILHTGKDLRRVNELGAILLRYGLGDLMRRMGLTAPLEQAGKLVRYNVDRERLEMPPAERLRCALEEMGPTFVKLGQILATRVDLFPPDWLAEFEKLQDTTSPIPFEELQPRIEESLGKPIEKAFRSVDPEPLGVASIAQVHRAVTRQGEQVILKIQKPGIRGRIDSDLRLLDGLAKLAADNSLELRRYRPVDLVREFRRSLLRELDFTIEARNAERIGKNMRSLPWLKVPRVYWKFTSERLAVQEYIAGIPARQIERLDAEGYDRALIARRGALAAWKMALEDGFFHADPHPGNFLILPGNRIGMLDFGMVGRLSGSRREQMVQIMKSVVMQDPEACAAVLATWSEGQPVKFESLASDVEEVISRYYGVSISELDVTALLTDITALVRSHNLVLPGDIALYIKAIITLEGFGRLMNPDFDLMSEAEPLIRRMVRQRYSPTRLARNLGLRALDAVDKLYAPPQPQGVPSQESGGIDPRHLERLVGRLERSQYRQVQTLLTVSGVLCGSILLAARIPPVFWDISLPGLLILMANGVWAGWLLLVARRHLREWD
jgi:ubiquinone biosynthesis protein